MAENKLYHHFWWYGGDNGFSIYYTSNNEWEITNYNLVFTSVDKNYDEFPSSGNYLNHNGDVHKFEISCVVENEVEGKLTHIIPG